MYIRFSKILHINFANSENLATKRNIQPFTDSFKLVFTVPCNKCWKVLCLINSWILENA